MAIFKSGNPTLGEKTFRNLTLDQTGEAMTVRGTLNRFGFLLLMLMAGAFYTWFGFSKGQNVTPFIWVGAFGGLALALLTSFKKEWSPYTTPAYAILEGLFIGALSAQYNFAFAERMPNIIVNAVGLTMGTAAAMYLLYSFGVIKATQRFRSIIISATVGIAIFYLIVMVLRMFGVPLSFMHDSSPLGIGISLFIVGIAALNLILDFDMIEQGAAYGAPKYMEWFSAFGLLVTLVWLYLEILRLLSRLSSRN